MSFAQIQRFALILIAIPLLFSACSRNVDSETVAYDFVRLYFVEDNLAEAVKLASGSARAQLEESLREIEAVGAKEPARDKPVVKAELLEMQPVSRDENLFVYRVTSDVEAGGMEPITARLWLSKEGNVWQVSKFTQEE